MAEGTFNNWVTSIGAVLGVVSTAAATFGAWQANLASERADQAKLAAEATNRSFEQLQYRDKQQFELYGKIESLLKENASGSLLLATTYVSLVKDPDAKGVWCAAVINYARIRETELTAAERNAVFFAKECLSDAVEQRAQVQATIPAAAVTPAKPAPAQALAAQKTRWPDKKVVSAGNPIGYDIDVFACESSGQGSVLRAEQLAKRLADKFAENGKIAHAFLGRVRLRWLSAAQEAEGGYPAGLNRVQVDDDRGEQRIAEDLAVLAKESAGQPFSIGRSVSGTDFYLSVFACGR